MADEATHAPRGAQREERASGDTVCAACGTDTREGVHNRVRLQDENSVVFECVVPRESKLPRRVSFMDLSGCGKPEYWFRQPLDRASLAKRGYAALFQPPDIGADVPGGGAV